MRNRWVKKPDSLVVVVKLTARLVSVMVTLAPARPAPDSSSTVPTMFPYTAWATAATGVASVAKEKQTTATISRMAAPPLERADDHRSLLFDTDQTVSR